ncbi:hypothetical protein J4438_03340 [Candidatus Woesearchaeota archaeon]|nr:hypothetical protein [Candidatus Woesearchaeota archaeon]
MNKYTLAKIGRGIGIAGVVASFIYVTNPKVDNPQEKYFITESPAVAEYFSTVETLRTLEGIADQVVNSKEPTYYVSYSSPPGLDSFVKRNFSGKPSQAVQDSLKNYIIGVEEDIALMEKKYEDDLKEHYAGVAKLKELRAKEDNEKRRNKGKALLGFLGSAVLAVSCKAYLSHRNSEIEQLKEKDRIQRLK